MAQIGGILDNMVEGLIDNVGGPLDVFAGPAQLMASRRRGNWQPWDLRREYEQVYKVITRSRHVGPNGVMHCPGIPTPASVYNFAAGREYDPDAYASGYAPQLMEEGEEGSWDIWHVTVRFSTEVPEGGIPEYPEPLGNVWAVGNVGGPWSDGVPRKVGSQTQPDMVAPLIGWDEETIHRAPPNDLDGKPFLNAADIPMSPAPVFDYTYPVLVVTRNEITFNLGRMTQYNQVYNSDTFLGQPRGCVMCLASRPKLKWHGKVRYHQVTYRLKFAPEIFVKPTPGDEDYDPGDPEATRRLTWQDIESRFLNAGTHEVWDANAAGAVAGGAGAATVPKLRWRAVRDADGLPVTTPRPLYPRNAEHPNLAGKAIPIHKLRDAGLPDDKPNYLDFRVREFKDLNALFYRGLQLPQDKLLVPAGTGAAGTRYELTPP